MSKWIESAKNLMNRSYEYRFGFRAICFTMRIQILPSTGLFCNRTCKTLLLLLMTCRRNNSKVGNLDSLNPHLFSPMPLWDHLLKPPRKCPSLECTEFRRIGKFNSLPKSTKYVEKEAKHVCLLKWYPMATELAIVNCSQSHDLMANHYIFEIAFLWSETIFFANPSSSRWSLGMVIKQSVIAQNLKLTIRLSTLVNQDISCSSKMTKNLV